MRERKLRQKRGTKRAERILTLLRRTTGDFSLSSAPAEERVEERRQSSKQPRSKLRGIEYGLGNFGTSEASFAVFDRSEKMINLACIY